MLRGCILTSLWFTCSCPTFPTPLAKETFSHCLLLPQEIGFLGFQLVTCLIIRTESPQELTLPFQSKKKENMQWMGRLLSPGKCEAGVQATLGDRGPLDAASQPGSAQPQVS